MIMRDSSVPASVIYWNTIGRLAVAVLVWIDAVDWGTRSGMRSRLDFVAELAGHLGGSRLPYNFGLSNRVNRRSNFRGI